MNFHYGANHTPFLAGSCVEETSRQAATFPVSFFTFPEPSSSLQQRRSQPYHVFSLGNIERRTMSQTILNIFLKIKNMAFRVGLL